MGEKQKKNSSGKRVIAIVLLIVGILSGVLGVLGLVGGGGKDPYEMRKGVVMIYSYYELADGDYDTCMGTGFAIGKPGEPVEYIVTNAHVVEAGYMGPKIYADEVISAGVSVYYSAAENDYVATEVVYYSPSNEKDIAILRLPSKTDKREAFAIKEADKVKIGDTAYALGYPGVASRNAQFNTYDEDDITLTKGVISRRTKPNGRTFDSFQMDVYINYGNSGGPLVDEQGNMIGINAGIAVDENGKLEGVNYAIISDELTKILDSEGIKYTKAGGAGFSWTKPWFGYVFLPIGVLALVVSIILLATSQKKGQGAPQASGASVAADAEKAPAGNGRGPVGKRAVLRGVTGKYSGQKFELINGKLVIGRDPATCNIVYDKGTSGISGRHCQVVYDPNEDCFRITDLGSSYGTFLGNGKKLTANVAEKMVAGDTFYLCDNNNRFVVSKE